MMELDMEVNYPVKTQRDHNGFDELEGSESKKKRLQFIENQAKISAVWFWA